MKAFEKTENKGGRTTGWVGETAYSDRPFKATVEECMNVVWAIFCHFFMVGELCLQ